MIRGLQLGGLPDTPVALLGNVGSSAPAIQMEGVELSQNVLCAPWSIGAKEWVPVSPLPGKARV